MRKFAILAASALSLAITLGGCSNYMGATGAAGTPTGARNTSNPGLDHCYSAGSANCADRNAQRTGDTPATPSP